MIEKGLTDRFLEVGKIKIGGKGEKHKSQKGGEYRLPVRFEHFVVTTTERDTGDNYKQDEQVHKLIGAEPKELSIRLPFDDIDMNFYTSFSFYESRKNKCRGNGIKAEWTEKDGKKREIPCKQDCKYLVEGKCKPSGILSCHISKSMNVGGIYRFRTHSWNTVSAILSALKYFKENIPGGILQGIPFKLVFLKKSTAEHGNVPVVTLVGDGQELINMRKLGHDELENRARLGITLGHAEQKAIAIGYKPEGNDKPGDVQDEFYGDTIEIEKEKGCSTDDLKKEMENKKEEPKQEKVVPKKTDNNPNDTGNKKQGSFF
jgi:hypothetical protein